MLVAAICKHRDSEEFHLVGATGKNYGNTNELKVMTYQEAMDALNREEWEKAIKLEHKKMVKYNVFQVVKEEDVPNKTKLMDFTWAMKKKPSGVYCVSLALRGFQQEQGLQYQHNDKSAPVINAMSIKIILVLVVLGNWFTKIIDVQGAFTWSIPTT